MKDIITTLQQYQTNALEKGMNCSLDVWGKPGELSASMTLRSSVSGLYADDQRFMKVTITSDDIPQYIETKMECINNFIYSVSTSPAYTTPEE